MPETHTVVSAEIGSSDLICKHLPIFFNYLSFIMGMSKHKET